MTNRERVEMTRQDEPRATATTNHAHQIHPNEAKQWHKIRYRTSAEKRWRLIAIILAALLVAAAVIIVLYKINQYAHRDTHATSYTIVCGQDIVERFNNRDPAVPDGTGDERFIRVYEDIVAMDGWTNDPTCQTIVFAYAQLMNDADGMMTAANKLQELNSKNIFANNELSGGFSVSNMVAIAEAQQYINSENNQQYNPEWDPESIEGGDHTDYIGDGEIEE